MSNNNNSNSNNDLQDSPIIPRTRRRSQLDDFNDSDSDRSPQRRRRFNRIQLIDAAGQNLNPLQSDQEDEEDNNTNNRNDSDYEEEGENLQETALLDYQRIAALDQYDSQMVDDRQYDAMTAEQRQRAEEEIDRLHARKNEAVYGVEVEEEEEERAARRGAFEGRRKGVAGGVEEEEEDEEINLEAFEVPLMEWISQDRTRREIQRRFRNFLNLFTVTISTRSNTSKNSNSNNNNGHEEKVYTQRIKRMAAANQTSLEVSYRHLMERETILAMWLADAPNQMLDIFNEVATRVTLTLFPQYNVVTDEIHVRVSHVPISDSLRDLRQMHLGLLVKVGGVVTRRTGVFPQIKLAMYDCVKCRHTLGPFRVEDQAGNFAPGSCPSCESTGPFKLNSARTVYRNYQKVTLQETPGSVPPGRVPRTKEIVLTNDLIDRAKPGEEVEVTGVYTHSYDMHLTQKSGFPVFHTHIDANHILKREDVMAVASLTETDKKAILKLARDPNIGKRIIQSIAPSIYGHNHVKRGIAMSLFGGVPKNIGDKHRIRGDINVLLLGDPGTAKSQVLKYAEKTAPRAVYSTGKGASAVGLTAAVRKDPITKEWTLEGGALVLADKGLCLIDEFDKMNEQDRTSIHEAMEQQSISISKAGIVTSLQARCSVIAAANPLGGRYDSSSTLAENVELTDPILQRFDVLCVLQDTVDPVGDERLAKFVTNSHMKSTPTSQIQNNGRGAGIASSLQSQELHEREDVMQEDDNGTIPQHLLRKYMQYARAYIQPKLDDFDQEKVASLYAALRKESVSSGGVPIAVRHIESLLRMAEAHAKMHLREFVREDDLDAAVEVMLNSFIQSQKYSVQRALTKSFSKYMTSSSDRSQLLLHILQDQFKQEYIYLSMRNRDADSIEIYVEEFESRAREKRIYNTREFLASEEFTEAGYVLSANKKIITRNNNNG